MGDEIAKEIIYNNSQGALSIYERLSNHNVTSDTSTVDINIDYSFDDFYIVYNGVKFDNTGNEKFTCTFIDKSNTELNSGHYQYSYENSTTDGSKRANYANTENNITLSKTVKSGSPSTGQIKINHMTGYKNSGDKYVSMDYHTQSKYDTHFSNITGSALINHNVRLKSIRFKFETSQITAGTFTLYTIRTGNHSNTDDDVWDRIEVHDITTSVSKIDLDIISDYDNYLVYFDGVKRGTDVDTNDDEFYITGESTNGIITGNNYMYTFNEIKSDGDYNVYYANDEVNIPITKLVKDGNFFNGCLLINNKNTQDTGGNNTTFDFSTQSRTTLLSSCRGSGIITHSDKIIKLNCKFQNNQISAGKITLFGLRNVHPPSGWSFTKNTSGNDSLIFNGNIGIGTTIPDNKLHIYTTDQDDGANILLESDGGSGDVPQASIYFKTSAGAWGSTYSTYDSGRIYSSWDSTDDSWNKSFISFQTHGDNTSSYTDDLVIKGGNIGIGTSNPSTVFHVNNDANPKIRLSDNQSMYTSGFLQFCTNGQSTDYGQGQYTDVQIVGNEHGIEFQSQKNNETSISMINFKSDGRIGLMTNNPNTAHLVVNTRVYQVGDFGLWTSGFLRYGYISSGGWHANPYFTNSLNDGNGWDNVSIRTTKHIYTEGHIFLASDKRIKTEISTINDTYALDQINRLESKEYHYKDPLRRKERKTIGFIAQEVKEVIPNAITFQEQFIPDELRPIEIPSWSIDNSGEYILHIDDLDLSGNHTGMCKFFVGNDISGIDFVEMDICVNDDKKSFKFEKKYNNVFLWGKEINDFHSLDKAQIFALHHSAIQELSRKNDAKSLEITELKTENNNKTQEIVELKEKLQGLETKNTKLEADLEMIKQHLGLN